MAKIAGKLPIRWDKDAVQVGGGIVVLYAAFWAARSMYGLIGTPPAFVLLASVTAVGCALSWRHDSLVVALIGLIGGFATPLMVSSGADRPIGLFAYVLLLDVGMLYLARQRRWPLLAVLSLAGTLLYEGMWVTLRMGPDRLFLGLVILGVGSAAPTDVRHACRSAVSSAAFSGFCPARFVLSPGSSPRWVTSTR